MNCKFISFEDLDYNNAMKLSGSLDSNIKLISELFGVDIEFRNNEFLIFTDDDTIALNVKKVMDNLLEMIKNNKNIDERDIIYIAKQVTKENKINIKSLSNKLVGRTFNGKPINPKTIGQLNFIESMEDYDIVFAIGPAGTGKTYLAVVNAVTSLKKGDVKKIVLTRPAVEAGESLGFLPGDLKDKVDPYLTPLYDALYDTLGNEQTQKFIEKGVIEIAPLAYMRGRTLDDSYIILDEAQNTTSSQMKMFLTRLGFNSKMVITGDITQIDLKYSQTSGLVEASNILKDIKEIKIISLSVDDVVRHPLVQKIIESYEMLNKC